MKLRISGNFHETSVRFFRQILLRAKQITVKIDCNLNKFGARFIVFSFFQLRMCRVTTIKVSTLKFVYPRREFFMRIPGRAGAATDAGYLWVESLQATWEVGSFSPVLLENFVGNIFTRCTSTCASPGFPKTCVNKNLKCRMTRLG